MTPDALNRLLGWLRTPGDDLSQRILHGGVWMTALNVSDRLLGILRLIVLARLLAPSDFGLMGIALLAMQVTRRMADLGIDSALVQRAEENVDSYLDTAWVMKIVRGLGLFVVLFVSAPLLASFFGEPRAAGVLRVLGVGLVVEALVNPSIIYFRKDLQFHKQFLYQISGTATNFTVAVVIAFVFESVWALVFGLLAGQATQVVVSYVLSDYRPSIGFDRTRATDVFEFGKWIWATGIVVFAATSGDDAFVGWYFAASALGFYQLAFKLSNAPATEVTHVISRVMFPAYSKLQDDEEALREAFLDTIRVTFVLSFPVAVGILLVAPEFTRVVLGEKWLPMVPAMQVMAISGLLRSVQATGGAMFQGYGVPHWDFRMNLVRALAIAVTIWPLTDMWGITGTAWSITVGIGVTLPIWLYKTADITGLSVGRYARSLLVPLLGATVMSGPVLLILEASLWWLAAAILGGALTYVATTYVAYEYVGENPLRELAATAGE